MQRARILLVALVSCAVAAAAACGSSGDSVGGGAGGSGGSGAATSTGGGATGGDGTGGVACEPGQGCCSDAVPCDNGQSCCDGACADTTSDVAHCGDCATPCAPDNASGQCSNSACLLGPCNDGFADCDGNPANGCEWDLNADGPCSCTPGETQPCYEGPIGTENVGACVGGMHQCDASGTMWGACMGQVLPIPEVCANGVDDDCDGNLDVVPDVDGDGWTACDGDCCEYSNDCSKPELVNPGAYDVDGNLLDDDCDGGMDNAPASCDAGLASNSGNAGEYAQAIDICRTTTQNPPLPQKTWGLIDASFALANGAGSPSGNARSIRPGFGNSVVPSKGSSLAVLSTGRAAAQAAPNNQSPNWAAFQGGQNNGTSSPVPADWLAANNNNFPNAPGCPDPQGGTNANDPIMLQMHVRVPTNAKSFTVATYFFSSEYPEWVCSAFNDFFLALLDSQFVPGPNESPNPADKNLAFYDPPPQGGTVYPVGVNLAFGNTGLFTQCLNGPTGCNMQSGAVPSTTNACVGTSELVGTGFDVANPDAKFLGDSGYCGVSNLAGGGTGWLVTGGNVKPGEIIQLRFVVWDTGDPWYDSLVLLDDFTWSLDAAEPGTHM